MTTLITGGTGNTGSRLARLLDAAGYPTLVSSRSISQRSPFNSVLLDWFNLETFKNPFDVDPNIDRVYLVVPVVLNCLPIFKPFIDLAIQKGVKRFVLLTSVHCNPGTPGLGEIHQYLIDTGVDYTVLRPSWFTDNLATSFFSSIHDKSVIRSASGAGRIPWVSSEDIAQAGFDALTALKSPNRDYYVLGPELYTYEELAKALSSELGREIIYQPITVQEQESIYIEYGVPKDYSHMLAVLTGMVGEGKEEAFFHEPAERKFIGKHTVKQFIREHRSFWLGHL